MAFLEGLGGLATLIQNLHFVLVTTLIQTRGVVLAPPPHLISLNFTSVNILNASDIIFGDIKNWRIS